jgi:NADH dehydrogenase [ubiquinone] 1 alpha subcomplex assembly factor 6
LVQVPTDQYLKKLEAANFNVFDPKLQVRNSSLALQLWLQKVKKTY